MEDLACRRKSRDCRIQGEGGEEVGERGKLNDRVDLSLFDAHRFDAGAGVGGDGLVVEDGGPEGEDKTHEKGE